MWQRRASTPERRITTIRRRVIDGPEGRATPVVRAKQLRLKLTGTHAQVSKSLPSPRVKWEWCLRRAGIEEGVRDFLF